MNDGQQDVTRQMQRTAVNQGQEMLEGTIELQRDATKMMLSALEWQETAQRQGIELSKSMLQNYLEGVQAVVPGMEEAMRSGTSASQGPRSGPEYETASQGWGQPPGQTPTYEQGAGQSRQAPEPQGYQGADQPQGQGRPAGDTGYGQPPSGETREPEPRLEPSQRTGQWARGTGSGPRQEPSGGYQSGGFESSHRRPQGGQPPRQQPGETEPPGNTHPEPRQSGMRSEGGQPADEVTPGEPTEIRSTERPGREQREQSPSEEEPGRPDTR